jgi:hypothetical protein
MQDVLFLLCFFGTPFLMLAAVAYLVVRHFVMRGAVRRVVREGGWAPLPKGPALEELAADLATAGLADPRQRLGDAYERDGLRVCRRRIEARSSQERKVRSNLARMLLVVERADDGGPEGRLRQRGGQLEQMALRLAERVTGERTEERPGWEWALLQSRGGWFPDASSPAFEAALGVHEALWLGPRHFVLEVKGEDLAGLMREAPDRAATLRAAARGGEAPRVPG